MIPKRPPLQVCQLCALDDFVELESSGPDLWRFRCSHTSHASGGHVWSPTPADIGNSGRSGIGEELGVYEDLLRCVLPNEWVEYGVVEHRYAEIAPDAYRHLVERYGHASLGPTKYSVSSFLAGALSRLRWGEGLILGRDDRATGYWSYLTTVSAFAQPGTDPPINTTSWASFATANGFDPQSWPSTAPDPCWQRRCV